MPAGPLRNELVHDCPIFDNSHKGNAAAEQLNTLPADKSHIDNENDVTFCDVADNGSAICKSKQNYARAPNSSSATQCSNNLRYRNWVDCDNFF